MLYASCPLAVGLPIFVLFLALKLYRKRISIHMIRGPPSPSWLLGHQYILRHAKNVGDYEAAWYREYGSVVRIAGVLSEPILLVSDPKALQYILEASGYRFPKSLDTTRQLAAFFGYGLVAAIDQDHQRQRKILNFAFSAVHLQSYLDVFHTTGSKLVHKLKDSLSEGQEIQNMLSWTQKATLDIIGVTSFRYSFGALDDTKSALEDILSHLFAEAQLFPSVANVFISQGVLRHLPESFVPIITKLPTRVNLKFQEFRKAMENIAGNIYHRELQLVKNGVEEGKDIINILALSPLSNNERKRMTDSEIAAQMATFIFAGYETTANLIAWLLYELSRHPKDQDKEALRLHPFGHTLVRVAECNDVLPLLEPITTRDGNLLKEIPIAKGQTIYTSIYMYNRNPIVWGNDAHEWNPKRFLVENHPETNMGMYGNLMSFSAGVRSCIGWRFAIMEIQALSVELLSAFEFSIPKDAPAIVHGPGSQALFPLLEDRPEEGAQMPLHVSVLKKWA
ncbi:cytochrome P450 [Mucidula mucida]|nr:cytochrome P450 [Mucidula mucida]